MLCPPVCPRSVGVAEADTSKLVDRLRRVKPYERVRKNTLCVGVGVYHMLRLMIKWFMYACIGLFRAVVVSEKFLTSAWA